MGFSLIEQVVRVNASFQKAVLAALTGLPDESLNMKFAAPIRTWDHAVPLGNGLLRGLLWGETNRLWRALDRGDLLDQQDQHTVVAVHYINAVTDKDGLFIRFREMIGFQQASAFCG